MRWAAWIVVLIAAHTSVPGVAFAKDTRAVPFRIYRGYAIVVRGSIGKLKNLNLLIDTGAVPSVVDRRVAQKLHLSGIHEKLSVFTEELDVERATARNVKIGSDRLEALPVVVRDLSFAADAFGTQVDGLIGFDFLSQGPFTIDYLHKQIVFGPIGRLAVAVHYEANPGYAVVEMKLQQYTLHLVVDTGANDLVLFGGITHDFIEAMAVVSTRTWSNMAGEIHVQEVQLKDAYLGSTPWPKKSAFILPSEPKNTPQGLSGLLGVASLKARRVAFDPGRRILAWD